jgi:serine/threonine-protein kinase RsbT
MVKRRQTSGGVGNVFVHLEGVMAIEIEPALRLPILTSEDIVDARHRCRELSLAAGFGQSTVMVIATALSEIARNMLEHAEDGEISIAVIDDDGRTGIEIVAADRGPGIADVPSVLDDDALNGSGRPSGLGLPGARRLMDEFEIASTLGRGTTVTMKKWKVDS